MSLAEQVRELRDGQRQQADELRGVTAGHRYLADQIADITVTLRHQDRRIEDNAQQLRTIGTRVERIDAGIAENTELTRDIRDLVAAGRVTGKIGSAVGKIVGWASALVIAISSGWYAITHGPKP
jgi:methyl-accepting chemotaxis protein